MLLVFSVTSFDKLVKDYKEIDKVENFLNKEKYVDAWNCWKENGNLRQRKRSHEISSFTQNKTLTEYLDLDIGPKCEVFEKMEKMEKTKPSQKSAEMLEYYKCFEMEWKKNLPKTIRDDASDSDKIIGKYFSIYLTIKTLLKNLEIINAYNKNIGSDPICFLEALHYLNSSDHKNDFKLYLDAPTSITGKIKSALDDAQPFVNRDRQIIANRGDLEVHWKWKLKAVTHVRIEINHKDVRLQKLIEYRTREEYEPDKNIKYFSLTPDSVKNILIYPVILYMGNYIEGTVGLVVDNGSRPTIEYEIVSTKEDNFYLLYVRSSGRIMIDSLVLMGHPIDIPLPGKPGNKELWRRDNLHLINSYTLKDKFTTDSKSDVRITSLWITFRDGNQFFSGKKVRKLREREVYA